jgi:hypothetical protein
MRLLITRLLIAVASTMIILGPAARAQAFQLEYFDTAYTLQACLSVGDTGLDDGSWYGYQCRTTAPHNVQLWVSFSP